MGLLPFGERDAPFFFGRERETQLITANLFASPLTLLYGGSGVGKSSVLRAGAVRQLRKRKDLVVVVFSSWQCDVLTGLHEELAAALKRAKRDGPSAPAEATLAEHIAFAAHTTQRRVMVILDQFEEYFLYAPREDSFAVQFAEAVVQTEAPASFLLGLREDALAALDRFEGSIPILFDNYLRIEQLDPAAARTAIEKPIEEYNRRFVKSGRRYRIEADLVDEVVEQVQAGRVPVVEGVGRGSLRAERSERRIETPFLQLVMTRLWNEEQKAGSHRIRLRTLKRLHGAEHIVHTHLDATMKGLTPHTQDVAASVFHYLVTPSGAKIAHTVSDLAQYAKVSEREIETLIQELQSGGVRILRSVAPPSDQSSSPRYEIFHDVLGPGVLDWRTRHLREQERVKRDQAERLAKLAEDRLVHLVRAISEVKDRKARDSLMRLVSSTDAPAKVAGTDSAAKERRPAARKKRSGPRKKRGTPVRAKTWPPGSMLRIRFLDGSTTQRKIVEQYAREWTEHANLRFRFGSSAHAQIRISFADVGSWSYHGTDALNLSLSEPTMNFGWITESTASEESRRVVLNQFGAALGLISEHQNPNATIRWNKPAVYRFFTGPPHHWTKETVNFHVLRKQPIEGYRQFDPKSIMMMSFTKELTLDRVEYGLNKVLSKSDKEFIRELYPQSEEPVARARVAGRRPPGRKRSTQRRK